MRNQWWLTIWKKNIVHIQCTYNTFMYSERIVNTGALSYWILAFTKFILFILSISCILCIVRIQFLMPVFKFTCQFYYCYYCYYYYCCIFFVFLNVYIIYVVYVACICMSLASGGQISVFFKSNNKLSWILNLHVHGCLFLPFFLEWNVNISIQYDLEEIQNCLIVPVMSHNTFLMFSTISCLLLNMSQSRLDHSKRIVPSPSLSTCSSNV